MKTIKHILTIIALFAVTGISAQKVNKQVTKKEIVKTYTIDQGDRTLNYSIKINTKETGNVTMKKSDLSKKEQDRVSNPVNVTRMISVDNDADPMYDNIFALTYTTKGNDRFSIKENKDGFIINVAGNELRYNFLKKEYNITKKTNDTFDVVVMKTK